ncbi:MAG TPA: 2-C-methyl-D-erythritol 2,4-cyclodiphosphate synthase [Bacteroidota bacterium]|nr:2-C-methyl-D-erythritol 2,4-cyclodiphosphate synthase [Bacteroidota bacterium]
MRVGIGYDVHPLVEGRKLIIGGVEIPFGKGLSGHSDADVLSHAIGDALLGAAALGNIGTHFPNDDPALKNISSLSLLKLVNDLLHKHQWQIVNIDSTVNLENPKIAPHIDLMRKNLAGALGVATDRVSVKATTGEGLGFIGRGDGAAAYAVALLQSTGGGS